MKVRSKRQSIRKALIIGVFLLFPVILNFLSPYLIVDSGSQGIINGSLLLFAGLFFSSLFLGRLWCGWVCPGAGLQETLFAVNDRLIQRKKISWIKWLIWIPWVSLIVLLVVKAGGYHSFQPLYNTETGVSVTEPLQYITYYLVLALIVGVSLAVGRRGFCHTVCWMAPFMILGRKLRNLVGWSSLRLKSDAARCADCKLCTRSCPMSLDVNAMVQAGKMENLDCILCGTCVDGCSKSAIWYSFSKGG